MKDKEFLQFIHDNLIQEHGVNQNYDYMHKLRAIIDATDANQLTPNVASSPKTTCNCDEAMHTFNELDLNVCDTCKRPIS